MSVVPIREDYRNLQPDYVLSMFMALKKAQGLAPRTISDYEKVLGLFFRRHPNALNDPRESSLAFLSAYENAASFNQRLAYLSSFWTWMSREGLLREDGDPLRGLRKRKAQHRIIQLSEKDIGRLLKQPNTTTYCGLRDYALLLLSIDTGARPNEALTLKTEDYNREEGTVTIRAEHAKTRTARTLPLSPPTMDAMNRLLAVRPVDWHDSTIFCNETGERLQVTSWSRRVAKYGDACGLSITAYSLRHVAALLLLRRGASAFTVQQVLGHANLNMTRTYINLTQEDTRREHATAGVILHVLGDDAPVPRKRLRNLSPS